MHEQKIVIITDKYAEIGKDRGTTIHVSKDKVASTHDSRTRPCLQLTHKIQVS